MRNRPPETRVELVALLLQLQKELAANESEILVAHADPALDPRLLLLEELKEATNLVRAKLCKLGGKSKTMPQKLARNAALTLVNVAHRCRPFIKARSILVLELPTVFSRLGEPYENEEPDPVRDDIELIAIRSAGGLIRACLLHQNRGAVLQMLTALGCPVQGLINRWGRAAGLTRDFTDPEPSMALASSQPPAGAALPVNDSAPPRTGSEHRAGSEPVQSTTPADVALPVHDIAPRPDDTLSHLEADMLHQQLLRVSNPDSAAASTVPGSRGLQCGELRDAGGGRLVFRGGVGLPPIPDDLDSLDVDLEHLVRPTVTPNPGDPTYSDLMHQLTAKDRSNQRVRFRSGYHYFNQLPALNVWLCAVRNLISISRHITPRITYEEKR